MKKILSLFFVFCCSNAHAIDWKIYGACEESPVHQGKFEADLNKSVGAVSLDIFKQFGIPYVGNEDGLNSLLNSPIGLDSIEVVSDEEMRVYGWCYLVNGKQPLELAGQLKFTSQSDKLIWFYAYSTNLRNEWIDYCSPAYWIKAKQFCGKKE